MSDSAPFDFDAYPVVSPPPTATLDVARQPGAVNWIARITAGVFLGILLWSICVFLAATMLLGHALDGFSDATATTPTPAPEPTWSVPLSQECADALDNGEGSESFACAFDTPEAISEHEARS